MKKLAFLLLSFSFAAFAQNAGQASKSTGKDPSDAQFATKAAQGNMAEVALGKLATQKSQRDDVKKFAQRMVDDHTNAEQDLEGIASKNNWTLPKDVNAQQKAEQQRLSKLSGQAFDRAYVRLMVQDHQKDVKEFEQESHNTSANSDLRDYATRTYQTLNDHLTMIKAVNDSMQSGSGSKSGSPGKGQ